MTIRFVVPEPAAEHVAFAYSPLLEAVLSLHVLAEPRHHPVQHRWVRRANKLPAGLRRQVEAFSFAVRSYFPEFVFPAGTGGFTEFDTELAALSGLPGDLVALEFSRPLHGGAVARDPALLGCPQARDAIARAASELPAAGRRLAQLVLDDPELLLREFQSLLADYWAQAFRAEWARAEPGLADAVSAVRGDIARRGLAVGLARISPELRVRTASGGMTLVLTRTHDHQVVLAPSRPLVLVPSLYVWPHVRACCDRPWPPGLVYSAPAVREEGRIAMPPGELMRVLRALADDTRLRLLRAVAARPRSTQELAPLLHISEATCSKHLHILADAGIIESARDGYYVLYSVDPSRLAALLPGPADLLAVRHSTR